MPKRIEKNMVVRHFKGNLSRVIDIGTHTDTGEKICIVILNTSGSNEIGDIRQDTVSNLREADGTILVPSDRFNNNLIEMECIIFNNVVDKDFEDANKVRDLIKENI